MTVRQLRNGVWQECEDVVSPEISITVDWTRDGSPGRQCSLWAWPADLEPLALGHVLLDRVHPAAHSSDPLSSDLCCGLRHTGRVRQTDSCSFLVETQSLLSPRLPEPPPLRGGDLLAAMAEFMSAPGLWDGTGCFHRAGLYNGATGQLVCRAEDIGRHNCIDRLAGYCAMHGLEISAHVLLLSARITASLYSKARRAGFSFLMSSSAVTAASVDMARSQDVTLLGFARDKESRFTVFSDARRRVLE